MFLKISSEDIPHSKRVSKKIVFYIKNGCFLKNFKKQNLIKIHTKTHQIAAFKKKLSGGGGEQSTWLRHAQQLKNLKIKFLAPSLILATPLSLYFNSRCRCAKRKNK